MKHNTLLIGSGGREHAMTWRIAQSESCGALFVAPGNAGTSSLATNVDLDISNLEAVKAKRLERVTSLRENIIKLKEVANVAEQAFMKERAAEEKLADQKKTQQEKFREEDKRCHADSM